MEDLPQGSGGIRLPIDALMVKGVPAATTLFTDNTLHGTADTTGILLHSINLTSDRPYNLGARFSARTTAAANTAYVKLRVQARTGGLLKYFETPEASTTSTTFTTLEVAFDTLLFATVAELYLRSLNTNIYVESRSEVLLANSGKLVGD